MRMALRAAETPLPTTTPHTGVNSGPNSETVLRKQREYQQWKLTLEKEAIKEVRRELKGKRSPRGNKKPPAEETPQAADTGGAGFGGLW
jgi:hypothetical protein